MHTNSHKCLAESPTRIRVNSCPFGSFGTYLRFATIVVKPIPVTRDP